LRERNIDLLKIKNPLNVRELCFELNESNDHKVGIILKRTGKKNVGMSLTEE